MAGAAPASGRATEPVEHPRTLDVDVSGQIIVAANRALNLAIEVPASVEVDVAAIGVASIHYPFQVAS